LKRKFITNLALLLLLNFLVKPFWVLGIDRTVQNVVGAETYGFYFSLFSFSLLLNMILDIGITNFNSRNIARNQHLLSKLLSNIVPFKFLLAIIYFAVSIITAWVLGYSAAQMKMLLLLIFNQFISSFILYFRSNLSGLHLFKTDSILSVLDRFLMILICGILLWGGVTRKAFRIEWFVFAQTAAYLLTALIAFGINLAKADFFKPRFDLHSFLEVLKQSYPFALLSLFMVFYYRVDGVMLERLLPDGKFQAGMYAQGYRILDAAAMVGFLFAGLLLPIFSRMIKKRENVESLTQISFLLLIVPTAIASFVCIFYKAEIMDLLYKSHVDASADILAILMIGYAGISTSYIFGTLLTANGNLKEMNRLAGISVVVNVVLNFALIPKYFALGSAIASMITQLLTALAHVMVASRKLSFSFNGRLIVRLVIFFAVFVPLGLLLKNLPFPWYIGALLLILSGLLISMILRLFSPGSLHQIIRSEGEME